MNIYELHSEPKSLSYHDKAQEIMPKLFWENYGNNKEELKKREKYIAKDAEYAYLYANDILKGPFPIGEEVISKSRLYSFYYAHYVLKGQFLLGEKAISKSANYSYYYAKDILKGPFLLGEKAISKSANYSYLYAKDILKGPFHVGEDEISKDGLYSYLYALKNVHFKEVISKDKWYLCFYDALNSKRNMYEHL